MGRIRQPYSLFIDPITGEYAARITTDIKRYSKRLGTTHAVTAHKLALEYSKVLNGMSLVSVKTAYLKSTQAGQAQRESVERSMDEFIAWRGNRTAESVRREDLIAYNKYMSEKKKPANSTSRHIKLAGIRTAFNGAGISSTPFKDFKMPKKKVRNDFLSKDQIKDLREAATNVPLYQGYIDLLIYTGARVGEIHNLCWRMVGENQFKLTGKTGPRMFPMDEKLGTVFDTIREYTLSEMEPEDYVLTDYRTGEQQMPAHGNLSKIVKRYMKDAELPGHLSAHYLRHTYISHMIMDGHSIHKVMKLTGHEELKTFERYLHLQPSFLENSTPSY